MLLEGNKIIQFHSDKFSVERLKSQGLPKKYQSYFICEMTSISEQYFILHILSGHYQTFSSAFDSAWFMSPNDIPIKKQLFLSDFYLISRHEQYPAPPRVLWLFVDRTEPFHLFQTRILHQRILHMASILFYCQEILLLPGYHIQYFCISQFCVTVTK